MPNCAPLFSAYSFARVTEYLADRIRAEEYATQTFVIDVIGDIPDVCNGESVCPKAGIRIATLHLNSAEHRMGPPGAQNGRITFEHGTCRCYLFGSVIEVAGEQRDPR